MLSRNFQSCSLTGYSFGSNYNNDFCLLNNYRKEEKKNLNISKFADDNISDLLFYYLNKIKL